MAGRKQRRKIPDECSSENENRGRKDILITCADGLAGFPEAIAAVFPKTEVQPCMIHMVRNPVRFAPYKDRKAVSPCMAPPPMLLSR
ncbi:MAG: transposase [Treponema sp.]|jgi:transposase-like protein|nr:transposase [Treponema sp.]